MIFKKIIFIFALATCSIVNAVEPDEVLANPKLEAVSEGKVKSPLVSPAKAVELLGTMQGGYNIQPLVDALEVPALAELAADALSKTIRSLIHI